MVLLPIKETPAENEKFIGNPVCQETIYVTIDFYKKVGFQPPWIGYYVEENGILVGCAAYKGAPVDGKVEIAYGTVESYRQQGIGTQICNELIKLSLKTDPSIIITARTLPEKNFSARILIKNKFILTGTVEDPEDGPVWEWIYNGNM